MSDSDETERFETQKIPSELVEAAGPWPYREKKKAIVKMLKRRAFGEEYVAADIQNELTGDHLETVQFARDSYRQRIEQHSVNGMIRVEDALAVEAESFIPVIHSLAREQVERDEQAEQARANRDADPEAASPGHEMSPVKAAEAMVADGEYGDGTVSDTALIDGPENVEVQTQAEKCGMDPDPFFEFALDHLDDSQLVVNGFGTRYDERESAVATDGGDSP